MNQHCTEYVKYMLQYKHYLDTPKVKDIFAKKNITLTNYNILEDI